MNPARREWMHAAANDPSSAAYSAVRMVTFAVAAMACGVVALAWSPVIAFVALLCAVGSALWWSRWRRGGWGR